MEPEQIQKELRDYKYALDQFAVVAVTDLTGKITYVNDRFCELSGYSRDELIGQTHRVVNSGYHPKEFFQDLWETVQAGKIWKNEVRNRRKDGSFYWADTTIVPFLDHEGKPYQYLAVRVDISRRKEMEAKLKEAIEVKSQFVSLVSHELRTPLTAIKQGIDIVDSGTTGPVNDEQREFLGLAKNNVDRLARLINGILDFQKLQAGKMAFDKRVQDLNVAVMEVFNTMKPMAQEKGIDLRLSIDKRMPEIDFDRDKIIQVLTNFVNNALKFTDEGKVEITTKMEANAAHIEVRDTGIGFDEEDKGRLFKSFEQLEGGRRRSGTGLGLAISREIVDLHNGKIWAESKKGEGSTFHFILPIIERREKETR